MYTKPSIKKIVLYIIYAGVLVWQVLLLFPWFATYFENQQTASYEQVPFELKLKAQPENVLFSEVYTTDRGQDNVKYAYLAGEVTPILNEDISRRTAVSQTAVLEVKQEGNKRVEKLKTTFFSKPQLYQDQGVWKHIEYATTTAEVFSQSGAIPYVQRRELVEWLIPGQPVFSATATYYPEPNVETTSVDGQVYHTVGGWSGTHNAATGSSVSDNGVTMTISALDIGTYSLFSISRAFMLFDTATLADSAVISSATITLFVTSKTNGDDDGTDTVDIVTSTPASNTALTTADYDAIATTLQATSIDIGSISTSAYNVFTLNSTGRGNISLTGVTKFGLREGHDTANVQISAGAGNGVIFSTADETSTTYDPALDITYTIQSFSMGNWFPF